MVCAVLSDVHANREALEAVLDDIGKRNIGTVFFLGDAVGYGPEPNECIKLLSNACSVLLAGNHDSGVTGSIDINGFNEFARAAVEWTRTVITEEHKKLLMSFPLRKEFGENGITLVHATPCEPEKWHYLVRQEDAVLNFGCFDTPVCFIGHTHRPLVIEESGDGPVRSRRSDILLNEDRAYIINVGSVGQPRDGDARACYVIKYGNHIEFVRIPYDIQETQRKMARVGLPSPLIERLSYGM